MYRLYLDTSNNFLTIVITKNNKIVISYEGKAAQKQTEIALKTINDLLKKLSITLKDINELVVTNGPGSYTGLRVAITFAKTLKVLNPKLVIFSINSLLLQVGLKKAISILTGYNNKSYLAVFDQTKIIIAPQLVTNEAKQGIINDLKDYEVIEDFKKISSIDNFLILKPYLIEIKIINDLQPLYIGDNYY